MNFSWQNKCWTKTLRKMLRIIILKFVPWSHIYSHLMALEETMLKVVTFGNFFKTSHFKSYDSWQFLQNQSLVIDYHNGVIDYTVYFIKSYDSSCWGLKSNVQKPLVIDYKYCVIDYTILKIFCHKLWLLRFEIQCSKILVIDYYFVKQL